MQDYFLESLKLQRIDFFLKLVAASECSDEEKGLALQWVSELTDELMAKIRSHELPFWDTGGADYGKARIQGRLG